MRDDRNEPEITSGESSPDGDSAANARREALKRLGIYAAYTAPAMLMLMHTRARASASVSSGATG